MIGFVPNNGFRAAIFETRRTRSFTHCALRELRHRVKVHVTWTDTRTSSGGGRLGSNK